MLEQHANLDRCLEALAYLVLPFVPTRISHSTRQPQGLMNDCSIETGQSQSTIRFNLGVIPCQIIQFFFKMQPLKTDLVDFHTTKRGYKNTNNPKIWADNSKRFKSYGYSKTPYISQVGPKIRHYEFRFLHLKPVIKEEST